MKESKFILVLCAISLFVSPIFSSFAHAEDEPVVLRYVIFDGNGIVEERKIISENEGERIEKALNEINRELRMLPLLQDVEQIKEAMDRMIKAACCLHDLKIFAFLLDWIEDIIDAYITPRTKPALFPHIFSYGHGRVLIPFYRPLPAGIMGIKYEAILGLLLRPIWWHYNMLSFTMVRNGHLFPPRIDFWDMLGRQKGFMIGFFGLYVAFYRPFMPDTHFFVGRTMFLLGEDLLL
ncbi:MAG: hypothetical protein FE048_03710 [Thermoplasmata archaeon]|nr:MAG: hypothetical protein FE048_03710 [Thermoplasmata archaeon]